MNPVTIAKEQETERPEPVELLDCGQASKVTKGLVFLVLWEMGVPPFDTSLLR